MTHVVDRRQFVKSSALAGVAVAAYHTSTAAAEDASAAETVNIAVMGVNGRGMAHVQGFAALPNCKIAAICDVDERATAKGVSFVESKHSYKPQALGDFRKALDDDAIDVLVVAAPTIGTDRRRFSAVRRARMCTSKSRAVITRAKAS